MSFILSIKQLDSFFYLIFFIPEDFNKRILTELSETQLVVLHKEAMELYETYLKSNAVHKVGVREDLVRQIASSEFLVHCNYLSNSDFLLTNRIHHSFKRTPD